MRTDKMLGTTAVEDGELKEWTPQERRAFFDAQARLYMGMSGDEFVRRYEAGEWPDPDADDRTMSMVMLLPFAE